jgi:hypothetical protein
MKALIENYHCYPGDHCGSTAMRGLLHHYCGLELPEAAVFGLGSGAASVYISGPGLDPQAMLFGRTATMEQDLAANLGIDYRERTESDDEEAWRVVRDEVLAGRPTMLSGDILYLDYREFRVHFPSHRFVLVGFDDASEQAIIADRLREEFEVCSYAAVAKSRNPPEGLSTFNLWGKFHDTSVGYSLVEASRRAIAKAAEAMLAPEADTTSMPSNPSAGSLRWVNGVAAVRAFAGDLAGWRERDDAAWIAGFAADCIERFGNGGGNFRRLYAGFLAWARELDPTLVPADAAATATEAADLWTAISTDLAAAAKNTEDTASWDRARAGAFAVADLEERLFTSLAA